MAELLAKSPRARAVLARYVHPDQSMTRRLADFETALDTLLRFRAEHAEDLEGTTPSVARARAAVLWQRLPAVRAAAETIRAAGWDIGEILTRPNH